MKKVFVFVVVLSSLLGQLARAVETDRSLTRTLVLRPVRGPALRIDFNYNFRNALPAFEKEPAFEGKEIARGLIPTVPPTPFIRNISDNELYLNTNHDQDFVTGPLATYKSTYVGHVLFQDLRVSTRQGPLVIPYTVNLITYEHGCAGWLMVRSGWQTEFELDGAKWVFGIVDNLDGQIDSEDHLFLRDCRQGTDAFMTSDCPVPRTLFFAGHTFRLDFVFKPMATSVVLKAALTEIQPPMGRLDIEAKGCRFLRLQNEGLAVVLNSSIETVSLPAGDYQIADCVLDYEPGRPVKPRFLRCGRTVSVKTGHTACLRIGPPLTNTVAVSRNKNLLSIRYQLVGSAGEQYEYYDWKNRPSFVIYKGPLRIARGILPFG